MSLRDGVVSSRSVAPRLSRMVPLFLAILILLTAWPTAGERTGTDVSVLKAKSVPVLAARAELLPPPSKTEKKDATATDLAMRPDMPRLASRARPVAPPPQPRLAAIRVHDHAAPARAPPPEA
jgi:hypothetical protein